MTSSNLDTALANPRRTSLAGLSKGSELAVCSQAGCHDVAVAVLAVEGQRTLVCRTHAG